MSTVKLPRPRPITRVLVDPDNAYARLGVSPLDSTEAIKALILSKSNELKARRGARADQKFGAEEEELTRLQQIENDIGSPRAREVYDREHPQNEMLTVQPSPRDRVFDRAHRAALVSGWLVEEFGRTAVLPSAECLDLWAPTGISEELTQALREFLDDNEPPPVRAPATSIAEVVLKDEEARLEPLMIGARGARVNQDKP